MTNEFRAATLTLPDGLSLPVVERGDPGGIPLLLLHGYTDSWRSFEPLLRCLPRSVRAIALTQRGHGDAGKPVSGYAPSDFAADAAAAMDELGLQKAVVLGHCMGGYVAQRLAIGHPGRVAGLVLVSSFPTACRNPGVAELWEEVSAFRDDVDPGFARAFQSGTVARPIPAEFMETFVRESLKTPARVWREALQGLLADDHSAELGRIGAPTLLLWGTRDGFFPRSEQDALLAAIAGSRLLAYEGMGHSPHWEDPERVARDVAAFAVAAAASDAARGRPGRHRHDAPAVVALPSAD